MPNGECERRRANTVRVSATPSPSASRSSVMRLALGWPAPAFFISSFMNQPLMPLPSSGLGGALVSATSTSPLGSTYSQRGCCKPSANARHGKARAGRRMRIRRPAGNRRDLDGGNQRLAAAARAGDSAPRWRTAAVPRRSRMRRVPLQLRSTLTRSRSSRSAPSRISTITGRQTRPPMVRGYSPIVSRCSRSTRNS